VPHFTMPSDLPSTENAQAARDVPAAYDVCGPPLLFQNQQLHQDLLTYGLRQVTFDSWAVAAAGSGTAGFIPASGNASDLDGTSAQLRSPQGIAVEPGLCGGQLIILDTGNNVRLHSKGGWERLHDSPGPPTYFTVLA
jgi:hypothetical protein